MLAVALIGFHLAVICADAPILGLYNLEVGLLPSVTVLTVALFSMSGRRRDRGRPFVVGFEMSLTVAICVYLVCCLTTPDVVRWPVVYYIDEIEPNLYDADLAVVYRLSLEIQGLILGLPQLLFALGGGAVANAIATARDTRSRDTDRRFCSRRIGPIGPERGVHQGEIGCGCRVVLGTAVPFCGRPRRQGCGRFARGRSRWVLSPQHRAQGCVAERFAQQFVGPEGAYDLGGIILLPI